MNCEVVLLRLVDAELIGVHCKDFSRMSCSTCGHSYGIFQPIDFIFRMPDGQTNTERVTIEPRPYDEKDVVTEGEFIATICRNIPLFMQMTVMEFLDFVEWTPNYRTEE